MKNHTLNDTPGLLLPHRTRRRQLTNVELQAFRKLLHMDVKLAAELMGCTVQSWYAWEHGNMGLIQYPIKLLNLWMTPTVRSKIALRRIPTWCGNRPMVKELQCAITKHLSYLPAIIRNSLVDSTGELVKRLLFG